MSLRAPDAEEISVVLVGSFNPGIFHPEWFRRQEILLPQEAEDAKPRVVSPEVTEVLFLDMKLDVFPDRFLLETHDASRAEKLQDIVINVLTRLPHTPVTACGLLAQNRAYSGAERAHLERSARKARHGDLDDQGNTRRGVPRGDKRDCGSFEEPENAARTFRQFELPLRRAAERERYAAIGMRRVFCGGRVEERP
jgi:hypothetical protein